jgi:hypothetical protein
MADGLFMGTQGRRHRSFFGEESGEISEPEQADK